MKTKYVATNADASAFIPNLDPDNPVINSAGRAPRGFNSESDLNIGLTGWLADNVNRYRRAFVDRSLANFSAQTFDTAAGDGTMGLLAQLEQLVPTVSTGNSMHVTYDENAFDGSSLAKDGADRIRGMKQQFKRVDHEKAGKEVSKKLQNKGLTCCFDLDQIQSDRPDDYSLQNATRMLMNRLLRGEIADTVTALAAAAAATGTPFTLDLSDPETDIMDCLEQCIEDLEEACAAAPNAAASHGAVFRAFRKFLKLQAKLDACCNDGEFTKASFAEQLSLSEGWNCNSGFCFDEKTGKTPILPKNRLILYNKQDTASQNDSSTVKRFVRSIPSGNAGKEGQTVSQQGEFRVFVRTMEKLCFVTVEHYSHICVTNPATLKLIDIVAPPAKGGFKAKKAA